MSNSPSANISESNQISVELLITDAKLALSLLDLADTTGVPEDRTRRIGEAHHAHETIVSFLRRLRPMPEQMEILNKLLSTLAARLRAAGVVLD